MKNLCLCFLILIFSLNSSSQSYTELSGGASPQIRYTLNTEVIKANESRYLNKNWKEGRIIYNDSTSHLLNQVNLDLTTNTFLFKDKNSIYTLPKQEKVSQILIGNDKFIRIPLKTDVNLFGKLIAENSTVSLVEYLQCKMLQGEPSKGFIKGTRDKYVVNSKYYLKKPDGRVSKKINFSRIHKAVSSLFPEGKDLIESFQRQEKIKLKDIGDLIEFIDFIDIGSE